MSEKKQDIGFNRELTIEEYIIYTACCAGPDKPEWLERGIFWCFDYQDYNAELDMRAVYEEYKRDTDAFPHMDMWDIGGSEAGGYLIHPKSWFYPAQLLAESSGCNFKDEGLSTSPVQVSGHNIFNFEAAAVGAGNEIKRSRKIFMDALKRVDSNGARVPQTICVNFTGVPGWTSTRINGVVYRFPAVGVPVKDALKYFVKEQYRVSVYQGEKLVNILASEALDKMPAFMKSLKKAPNGNGLMLRVVPEELVEIRK